MIEKKGNISPSNIEMDMSDTALLAQSQQLLELTTNQARSRIHESFAKLTEALQSREKQLLRQVDVLHSQQIALLQSCQSVPRNGITGKDVKVLPELNLELQEEKALCERILSFGKVNVEGGSLLAVEGNVDPYRLEDYQDAKEDHMCLYKPLSVPSASEVIKFGFVPRLAGSLQSPEARNKSIAETEAEAASQNNAENVEPLIPETDVCRRPSQVQEWLQEIMVQTETEPSVAEQEKDFVSIGQTQLDNYND